MKALKSLMLLLALVQITALSAQYAELTLDDCFFRATIVDFEKSAFFQNQEQLVCYLEKELIPDVWQKVSELEPSTANIVLAAKDLIPAKYRVSFIVESRLKTKQTIVGTYAKDKKGVNQKQTNVWISNEYNLTETGIKCEERNRYSDIEVYPNPSTGKINITLNEGSFPIKIIVNNAMGKTVETLVISAYSDNTVSIDLQYLTPGIYWLKADDNTRESIFHKIIIL